MFPKRTTIGANKMAPKNHPRQLLHERTLLFIELFTTLGHVAGQQLRELWCFWCQQLRVTSGVSLVIFIKHLGSGVACFHVCLLECHLEPLVVFLFFPKRVAVVFLFNQSAGSWLTAQAGLRVHLGPMFQ